jgi:polar amino acid transport system substrate-binding protein
MRAQRAAIALALAVCMVIASHAVPAMAQETAIQIAGDEEKRGGYLAEITGAAFKRAGYKTEFSFVPWARALQGTIIGHYDVLLAAYYTEERAKKLMYSDAIGDVEVYFWKKRERVIPYERLEDMKPFVIGFIRSSSVSEEFDKAMASYLTIQYASKPELNVQRLLNGRIDVFVEKKQQVDFILRTKFAENADNIVTLGPPLKTGKFFNAFSRVKPRHQKILDDFNSALKAMRADGTEKAILAKYGLD